MHYFVEDGKEMYQERTFTPILLLIKVAEDSFQVPMPNSLLLLNYLCFWRPFLQESRLTTEESILVFWLGCVKNKP